MAQMAAAGFSFLQRGRFQQLFDVLQEAGYRCVGPRVTDGAILYDTVTKVEDLPQAVRDRQAPGHYRLESSKSELYFAWANGPQALKPLVFKPRETLWQCQAQPSRGLQFETVPPEAPATAVIGVRACDLAALRLQDRHFIHGPVVDPAYLARRRNLFLVAVNCTHPADTCFCRSTGDGPQVTNGFDLLLSEIDAGFVIEARTDQGVDVLGRLPTEGATAKQLEAARQPIARGAQAQTRRFPTRNLRDTLLSNLDHPRWQQVAERCLSCGNCTAVCPTCFCHSEGDEPTLDGSRSEHYRQWGSCFTRTHSYIHGLVIRGDTRLRYRQWLTHKLGTWHEQYGRSGCVGCGRCISWCPVGIDLTEEIAAICASAADA